LTRLSDETLAQAIENGTINPEMQRADVPRERAFQEANGAQFRAAATRRPRRRSLGWRRCSVTAPIPSLTGLIPDSDTAALEDLGWFAEHPDRRFRARAGDGGLWLIRKAPQGTDPDVFLPTFSSSPSRPLNESDGALVVLWYETAYPDLSAETAQNWARKAIERGARRWP
jgi:hypothetical protein